MAEVMEMLALSPTMEEGTLAEWLKKEGDRVEEGDIIAEVETDKATMEMESFYAGTILKLLVKPGSTVLVGDPLVIIGEPGEDISALLGGGDKASTGDDAKAKTAPAAPSREPERRDEAATDRVAAGKESITKTQESAQQAEADPKPTSDDADGDARLKASPLARRMAKEAGLALEQLSGSGPQGRIVKTDIEQALSKPKAAAPRAAASAAGEVARHELGLSQMRKTIARRLVQVWQSTPHFFLTMDIDMAPAMAQRKQINDQLAAAGESWKVSVNDLIIKACALALERYPKMNVAFEADQLFQFDEINIGVAVAVDEGLITPTIRNAHEKSLRQIAREAKELAQRARDKKLKPEEYSSHTFSISNLGMYDIDNFLAVLNPPDAGILACGSVQQVAVVKDGEITIGTRMKVTLSCDHRAVDGAVGATFLKEVRALLENPILMLV
ncbi:MAG: pyruvate dehydrogenase complex dihydrolipoamide acetyltransferase [Bradymonadaceae bacterium]|nr:pyruvate dehydrogenase complex dihydrolipoamide acetyltransferase [Lujinxingiaceae bacterium]